jgi:hypothetical protein
MIIGKGKDVQFISALRDVRRAVPAGAESAGMFPDPGQGDIAGGKKTDAGPGGK